MTEGTVSSPFITPTRLASLFFGAGFEAAKTAWLEGTEATVPDDLTHPAVAAEGRLESTSWRNGVLAASLGTIQLPVLVASGSNDALFPAPDSTLLGTSIAGAESIVYQGADYASIIEYMTEFVSALEKFTG